MVLGLVSVVAEVIAGSVFELFSSTIVVLASVSAIGEVNAGGLVSSVREVNTGSADELFASMNVALGLVSAVAEVNTGSGSGVGTELGLSSGISDDFSPPMLLLE